MEARRLLERSVALDPRFATALAQLTFANVWEMVFGRADATEKKIADTLATARRAVELDPRDPFAQAALGWAYLTAGDGRNGLDAAQRAVDLNPSMPEAWNWLGWAKLVSGDPEACIAATERARRLNPQGYVAGTTPDDNLAAAYWESGQYQLGLEAGRRLVAALPGYYWGYVYVA